MAKRKTRRTVKKKGRRGGKAMTAWAKRQAAARVKSKQAGKTKKTGPAGGKREAAMTDASIKRWLERNPSSPANRAKRRRLLARLRKKRK